MTSPHPESRAWQEAYDNLFRENERLRSMTAALRKVLFMSASHCQGGSSTAGAAIASLLGVSFPVRMDDLERAAKEEGLNPDELWPWLKKTEEKSS